MATLTYKAISVTERDRVKRTKILDHIQIVIIASFVFALAKTFHDSCHNNKNILGKMKVVFVKFTVVSTLRSVV